MSKQEVATLKQSTFTYDYKPAVLEIHNIDVIDQAIDSMVEHYDSIVFEPGDSAGINQAHKELNGWRTQLEEGRKSVKREYNKPLNEFELQIKRLVAKIDKPLARLKKERDLIEEKERKTREEALAHYLQKQAEKAGIEPSDIEREERWLNKGNWTDRLNPRKALREEVEQAIQLLKEEQKKHLAEREVLRSFFEKRTAVAPYYMEQFENGRSSTEIMQEVISAEEREKSETKEEKKSDVEVEAAITEVTEDESGVELDEFADFFDDMKVTVRCELSMSVEQMQALEEFIERENIQVLSYERV